MSPLHVAVFECRRRSVARVNVLPHFPQPTFGFLRVVLFFRRALALFGVPPFDGTNDDEEVLTRLADDEATAFTTYSLSLFSSLPCSSYSLSSKLSSSKSLSWSLSSSRCDRLDFWPTRLELGPSSTVTARAGMRVRKDVFATAFAPEPLGRPRLLISGITDDTGEEQGSSIDRGTARSDGDGEKSCDC